MIDLDRFWEGDPTYLAELVKAHGAMVFRIAERFGKNRDHADDLYQEAWIRVYENRRAYQGQGAFPAWLQRVAVNVCRDDSRAEDIRRRFWEKEDLAEAAGLSWASPSALEVLISQERLAWLTQLMRRLPRRERSAVQLRYLEARSYRSVADAMGIRISTARSLVRNGIQRLRAWGKGRPT